VTGCNTRSEPDAYDYIAQCVTAHEYVLWYEEVSDGESAIIINFKEFNWEERKKSVRIFVNARIKENKELSKNKRKSLSCYSICIDKRSMEEKIDSIIRIDL